MVKRSNTTVLKSEIRTHLKIPRGRDGVRIGVVARITRSFEIGSNITAGVTRDNTLDIYPPRRRLSR